MGNVMLIPARRQVGNNARKQEEDKPKLRVAAYCRVSTDSDEQATSYESQVEHYTEYIQKNPEWEFADMYVDMYNRRLLSADWDGLPKAFFFVYGVFLKQVPEDLNPTAVSISMGS